MHITGIQKKYKTKIEVDLMNANNQKQPKHATNLFLSPSNIKISCVLYICVRGIKFISTNGIEYNELY